MLKWNGPWRRRCETLNQDGCVEAAQIGGVAAFRDSTLGNQSPILTMTPRAWDRFRAAVKDGHYDRSCT